MDKIEFQKILGGNIRRIRISKSISVESLAYEAGLTYSQISRIELGKINPTAYTLYILSKALDVNLSDFFTNTLFTETRNCTNGA
jgi:transcriptional regulator with XRE-family HTH domain